MSIKAQLQIRQNAMEIQDYMKDLVSWEKEVKRKDKSLSTTGNVSTSLPAPPPRGRTAGDVQPAAPELQQPALSAKGLKKAQPASKPKVPTDSSAAHAAAHTYDHWKKWDKFDPDADSDEDSAPPPPEGSAAVQSSTYKPPVPEVPISAFLPSTTPVVPKPRAASRPPPAVQDPPPGPAIPPVRRPPQQPDTAEGWKDRGNELFKVNDFLSAVECYTHSIAVQPTAVAYSNRAMAHLKLKQHLQAEQDCDQALLLDPHYLKAFLRRATARQSLGKLLEALDDFEVVLRHEPSNKAIRTDRDACFTSICKKEFLPTTLTPTPITVTLAPAPPTSTPAPHPSPDPASTPTPSTSSPPSTAPSATTTSSKPTPIAPPKPSTSRPSSANPSPRSSKPPPRMPSLASVEQVAARVLQNLDMKPPSTSTEFEANWRSFKGNQRLQGDYLKIIDTSQLRAIFKSSMTPPVLSGILQTLLCGMAAAAGSSLHGAGAVVEGGEAASVPARTGVAWLQRLPEVDRFTMNAMCIPGKDKAGLKAAWERVEAAAAGDVELSTTLLGLRSKYRL